MLNEMENTITYGELFLARRRVPGRVYWDSKLNYPRFIESQTRRRGIRPFSTFSFLDQVFCQPGSIGFKIMYSQVLKHPELLAYFSLHQISIVHLIRRNTLDVIISEMVKRESQHAHLLLGQPEPAQVQVELDAQNLTHHLIKKQYKVEISRSLLRWFRLHSMEIAYEDLENDPAVFQAICDFLAIHSNGALPRSNLRKIRRNGYTEIIRNYNEVKDTLSRTPFAHFLE